MAARSERYTVGTTPVLLTSAETGGTPGSGVLIKPLGAGLLVGGPTITAATGYPLTQDEPLPVDLKGDRIYGITASGTVQVAVLRVGI